jgi:hypothetical protein
MPAAMVLDRFYGELDLIADDLLRAALQGRSPGLFPVVDLRKKGEVVPIDDAGRGADFTVVSKRGAEAAG